MSEADFAAVFAALKPLLAQYQGRLDCPVDEDGNYYLNSRHIMKNGQPLFFGAVQIKKNYVSYHLMPVYVFPELLDALSPALKKRMQGKSCFNFKVVDGALFAELAALTGLGFEHYQAAGYL